mgnify:CR=1 FL=1
MAETNEIVLDIKINTEEVAGKLAAATKALAEHKQQQKELKKAMEEITEAYFTICKSSKFISELRRIRRDFQGTGICALRARAETRKRVTESLFQAQYTRANYQRTHHDRDTGQRDETISRPYQLTFRYESTYNIRHQHHH